MSIQRSGCRYIGTQYPSLKGKTALLRIDGERVLAQFDDATLQSPPGWPDELPPPYGQHTLPASDFDLTLMDEDDAT